MNIGALSFLSVGRPEKEKSRGLDLCFLPARPVPSALAAGVDHAGLGK
jgi:hypothetical protein